MARVVQKRVRGTPYIQVVEDYPDDDGVWRQKVLKSFGAFSPDAYLEAVQYAAAANEFKERLRSDGQGEEWRMWKAAAALILGGVAVAWLLDALGGRDGR